MRQVPEPMPPGVTLQPRTGGRTATSGPATHVDAPVLPRSGAPSGGIEAFKHNHNDDRRYSKIGRTAPLAYELSMITQASVATDPTSYFPRGDLKRRIYICLD